MEALEAVRGTLIDLIMMGRIFVIHSTQTWWIRWNGDLSGVIMIKRCTTCVAAWDQNSGPTDSEVGRCRECLLLPSTDIVCHWDTAFKYENVKESHNNDNMLSRNDLIHMTDSQQSRPRVVATRKAQ